MVHLGLSWNYAEPKVWLLAGAMLLYAASMLLADLLGGPGRDRPGRRAIGHWLPIAAAAMACSLLGTNNLRYRCQLALEVVFATSIAALSLVMGAIFMTAPQHVSTPPQWRRMWPFVLPVALLTVLAGFRGALLPHHAGIMLLEGVVLWLVWNDRRQGDRGGEAFHGLSQPVLPLDYSTSAPPEWYLAHGGPVFACFAVLALIVGAVCAAGGTGQLAVVQRLANSTIVVSAALGPLLVAPIVLATARQSRHQHAPVAATTAVGVVLLNLCLLLPMVIVSCYVQKVAHTVWQPGMGVHGSVSALWQAGVNVVANEPLALSLVLWRVDCVLLVLLSLILVPASLERWRLGPTEGLALVALYGVYILAQFVVALNVSGLG